LTVHHAEAHPGDAPQTGLSVARLLDESLFAGSLVAGEAGTGRPVAWCLPLGAHGRGTPLALADDVAGAAVFAAADELGAADVEGLLGELAGRGAALVVVPCTPETARTELKAAVAAADEVGLPLLAVGPRATFREVSRLVATKVLAQATHVLEYGMRVHRALGDVFARGAGLSALAQTMAQLSGTTVLVLGNGAEVLTQAFPPTGGRTPAADLERVVELVGVPDREPAPGAGHDVDVLTLDLDEDRVEVVVAPIRVAGEPYGVLVLVEPDLPTPEHDLARHRVIAEQGVSLTGSELLRMHSVRQAEERARNDFVHALLHGRFTDQLELAARAEPYRLPVDGRYAVFIVTTPGLRPDEAPGQRVMAEVERTAKGLSSSGLSTLTSAVGGMVVVVRQLQKRRGADRDPGRVAAELAAYGADLQRGLRQRLGVEARVAFGRPFNGATGIASSYREARTAEGLARRVQAPSVCSYDDLRVFAALEEAAGSASGKAFATELLSPLQQTDGQTGNLEELVLAYIEEAGNLNATARRLHLHRNTMLYKLERASRALGMDIRTTEAQFMVWLAHHLRALNDVVTGLDDELSPPS
jgi:sugar diacid utilization regulator